MHAMTHKPFAYLSMPELQKLCNRWRWLVGFGIASMVLGGLALTSLVTTTFTSVLFLGAILLLTGVIYVIQAFWMHEWRGFFLFVLLGILYAVAGALMIMHPATTMLSLTLLLGAAFLVAGIYRIITSLSVNIEHWALLLINGIVSVILGWLILQQWPVSALWVLGLFVGIELLLGGWYLLTLGLHAHRSCTNPITRDEYREIREQESERRKER